MTAQPLIAGATAAARRMRHARGRRETTARFAPILYKLQAKTLYKKENPG